MAGYVRVRLPSEIADELVAEGAAVHSFALRGANLGEAIGIAVETVNTGGALVSLVVAASTCRKLARSFIRRRLDSDPDELNISVTADGEVKSIRIDRTAPDAEAVAFDFFVTSLNVG